MFDLLDSKLRYYRDVFLDDAFVSSDSLTNGVLLFDEKSISSMYS